MVNQNFRRTQHLVNLAICKCSNVHHVNVHYLYENLVGFVDVFKQQALEGWWLLFCF